MIRYLIPFLVTTLWASLAMAETGYEVTSKDGDKVVRYMVGRFVLGPHVGPQGRPLPVSRYQTGTSSHPLHRCNEGLPFDG